MVRYLLMVMVAFGTLNGLAQTTRVVGRVVDATTGEGLPFVNIAFVDSKIGTITDMDGGYALETYYATDSIRVSFVGYVPASFKVKREQDQRIDISLEPSSVQLGEFEVRPPDENPAFAILRRVIAHKPVNNREKLEAYEYESYNKIEFDLNNITEEFTQKKLFKPFDFIFDNIDSSDAKPYLPIFMTETLSERYYRQSPNTQREIIHGTRVSGLENESISQFMGDMYQNVNIYDNFLVIFGKNFVSPIADGGKGYYNYYLTDSAFVGKYWCYKLEFTPKRVQELAFKGEMWINDTTYAVRRIEAGIAEGANLNFVQGFWVRQEYDQVEKEVWMLTRDELVVDLNLVRDAGKPNKNQVQGFYGRRTASYRDFIINKARDEAFYAGMEQVVVLPDTNSDTEAYWLERRHEELSEKEAEDLPYGGYHEDHSALPHLCGYPQHGGHRILSRWGCRAGTLFKHVQLQRRGGEQTAIRHAHQQPVEQMGRTGRVCRLRIHRRADEVRSGWKDLPDEGSPADRRALLQEGHGAVGAEPERVPGGQLPGFVPAPEPQHQTDPGRRVPRLLRARVVHRLLQYRYRETPQSLPSGIAGVRGFR